MFLFFKFSDTSHEDFRKATLFSDQFLKGNKQFFLVKWTENLRPFDLTMKIKKIYTESIYFFLIFCENLSKLIATVKFFIFMENMKKSEFKFQWERFRLDVRRTF